MHNMKIDRLAVFNKCNARCGYCGSIITFKNFQVDHMIPKCDGGSCDHENLLPTCRQCNHYKRGSSVEQFREYMKTLHLRLAGVYIHKVAMNFKMATLYPFEGVFYFEKLKPTT